MHVLILALRRGIIKTNFAYLFFLAKWLSHNFNRMILRKKERGRKPSCPPNFWLIKKATRTFKFLRIFLLVKDIRNLYLAYVKNFLFSCFYYTYERVRPLVSTSLFTLNLKFCPNSLRMTPESQKP